MPINSLKWNPNSFTPKVIGEVTPLLDRTHTPRSATKAIALKRSSSKELWFPNKHQCEDLEAAVTRDEERGKWLNRMVRRRKA